MSAAKILLVDDSAMARRAVRQILESAGYAVAEAEDGLIALERYFLEKPDLVNRLILDFLADEQVPKMLVIEDMLAALGVES